MNTKNLLSQLLVLFISLPVFTQNTNETIRQQIFRSLIPAAGTISPFSGRLAKHTAAVKDTMVASRIDNYSWDDTVWTKDRHTILTYNETGFLASYTEYMNDTTLISKTMYSYDPDGRTIHLVMINEYLASIYGNDTTVTTITYFPSYPQILTTSSQGIGMTYLTDELFMASSIDSMRSVQTVNNATTSLVDTLSISSARYQKISDDSTTASMYMYFSFMKDEPVNVNYTAGYYYAHHPTVDTLFFTMSPDDQSRESFTELFGDITSMSIILLRDQQGRIIEQSITYSDPADLARTFLTYSVSGTLESEITQVWDTLSGTWVNFQKFVYTYSTISMSTNRKSRAPSKSKQPVCAVWNNGLITLSHLPGISISSAAQYNLQGKVLSHYNGSFFSTPSNSVVIPAIHSSNTISLLRVFTNQGTFTFKLNDLF